MTDWALELGLSRDCLLRAIAMGHLRARRLGVGPTSPWYCDGNDITEWLNSRIAQRRPW